MPEKKVALVTGGAGFIGSHLVDRLVREGFRVIVVDNLSTGHRRNFNAKAEYHELDIAAPALADVFSKTKPRYVFHLAAQASVVKSVADPVEDARTNILGSLNLLVNCQRFGVEQTVYSSSSSVYGDPERRPCQESHPVRPSSPYAVSKYTVELYLSNLRQNAGLRAAALRYGNVFGPRQDPEGEAGVIAIFFARMLRGDDVTIFDDGDQTRDYVYVDDVVEANMRALQCRSTGSYNIGTAVETSVNALFREMASLTRYQKKPIYRPPRPGDVRSISLDFTLARRELGWSPKVSLRDGLAATLRHFGQPGATS